MAYFLLASTIVASFSLLALLYRLNRQLASWPVVKNTFLPDKILRMINTGGKWLTLTGGVATLPSVLILLFFPAADQVLGLPVKFIILLGMAGMLAFVMAALLLIPACLDCCLARPFQAKRLFVGAYRFVLRKSINLVSRKAFWLWLAGTAVVIAFLPFFIELFTFITYAIALLGAGRLGLLGGIYDQQANSSFLGWEDESETYDYEDDEKEKYQQEVDLGFH